MSNTVIVQAAEPGSRDFTPLVWQKLKVRKSLDEICHYMELTLPSSERGKIRKHDRVEVRVRNPLIVAASRENPVPRVATVMVDEVRDSSDASKKYISVIGRSPARDIIDSKWHGSCLNQTNLEGVANYVAGRFGIPVTRMGERETEPVFAFTWGNESPWTKLINEADNQGWIFTSNEAGGLILWQVAAGVRREGFALEEGLNIREIEYTQNGAEQFHEYIVRAFWREAREIDHTCRNNRILTINLTDVLIQDETLRRRARTEMLRRRENRVLATVSGWGLEDAQIRKLGDLYQKELFWNPNFLIPVRMPSFGLNDRLLVSKVEYVAEPSLMKTALTLVNPEAYS